MYAPFLNYEIIIILIYEGIEVQGVNPGLQEDQREGDG